MIYLNYLQHVTFVSKPFFNAYLFLSPKKIHGYIKQFFVLPLSFFFIT